MALPLPKVISDVGPGGPLVTSMRGMNALQNDMLANQIEAIKAQYAPLTALSESASKLAYAKLMGPQFMAKLMGNKDILANMPNPQQALDMLTNAAISQSNNPLAQPTIGNAPSNGHGYSNYLVNKVRSTFEAPKATPYPQDSSNPKMNALIDQPNLSSDDREGIVNLSPGQSYVVGQGPRAFAENAGAYEGIKAEGSKAGELRAQDVNDLGGVYESAINKEATLNDLGKIVTSPEFMSIRQLPIGQQAELGYYKRFGTPEQQKMIGRFITQSGKIIQDSAQDFKGQFRKGEQELLENMKINASDPANVAVGKLESLITMNQILKQRTPVAAKLMQDHHLSKFDALNRANSMIKVDDIRKGVQSQLNPMVTIRNRKTGETITVSHDEATKMMQGAK